MSSSASYIPCKATFAVVSISLLIALSCPFQSEARSVNLPSPQCHPSIINSMPPKIRKICDALSTIWEFSDAMENYLDEKASLEEQALLESMLEQEAKAMGERRSEFQQNTSVKRKSENDVDHVFLRFGKRGWDYWRPDLTTNNSHKYLQKYIMIYQLHRTWQKQTTQIWNISTTKD